MQLGALAGIGRLPWEPGTVVYDQDFVDRSTYRLKRRKTVADD